MASTEDASPPAPVTEQQSHTSAQVANMLFGCPLYGMYTRWQSAINQPEEAQYYDSLESYTRLRDSVLQNVVGNLPTPAEYIGFMGRIKYDLFELFTRNNGANNMEGGTESDDLPALTVASLCSHKIHPGNPCAVPDLCPSCVMWQCVNSLYRIAQVWRLLGGPHRTPNTPDIIKMYSTIKRIWYLEKNRWSNLVFKYEGYAALESQWEAQTEEMSLQAREAIQETQSCTSALRLARQVPFLVEGWDKGFVPSEKGINAQRTVRELMHHQALDVDELASSPPYSPDSITDKLPSENSSGSEEHVPHDLQRLDQIPPTTPREDTMPFPPSPTIKSPVSTPSPSSTNSYTTSRASSSEYTPSLPSPPPPPSSPSPSDGSRLRVTFKTDVQDSSSRPPGRFKRKSTFYQPGKYACPRESEWVDTSFSNDAMYDVFGSDDDEETELMEAEKARDAACEEAAAEGESAHAEAFRIWQDTEHDLDPAAGLAVWNPVPPTTQQDFPDAIDPALLFDGESLDTDTDGANVLPTPFPRPIVPRHTYSLSETHTGNVNGSHNRRRSREEFEQTEPSDEGPKAKRHCQRDGIA